MTIRCLPLAALLLGAAALLLYRRRVHRRYAQLVHPASTPRATFAASVCARWFMMIARRSAEESSSAVRCWFAQAVHRVRVRNRGESESESESP